MRIHPFLSCIPALLVLTACGGDEPVTPTTEVPAETKAVEQAPATGELQEQADEAKDEAEKGMEEGG
ncbi:MAG: hypothetical protein AB1726_18725 [Planctomycetota bacterium]